MPRQRIRKVLARVRDRRLRIEQLEERKLLAPLLAGDYSYDDKVDASDYVVWRNTLDNAVPAFAAADGNGSHFVDPNDWDVWKANFGQTLPPSGGSTFVPPPIAITPTNPVQTVRVIVLNFEPTVPSEGNHALWQIFHWSDPRQLAAGYVADIEAASGGAIDYQIIEWRDLNEFPIFTDGFRYTADQYVQNRNTNTGWNTNSADFYAIAKEQGLAQLVNDRVIDEIWTFGDHYFNLLGEAWMAGPQSFFINGPSFPNFPVDRAVAGFGFSYERGVAEMIHDLGHRTENHISRAYGGWNITNPVTPWDLFTANAGQTNRTVFGVGSTHYPFNAATDYDTANTRTFDTYADDFVHNFPNQSYAATPKSRDAWGDLGVGNWERGYQRWFFGHVPRSAGTAADGRQNNWYKYIFDFNTYRPNTGLPRDNEAILGAPPVVESGGPQYEFTLRYYDVQGIDTTTLDSADVLVTGPGGFSQIGTLVNIGPQELTTAGNARTVRYRISAPGGSWDAADSGAYTVGLRANQVRDVNGTLLLATQLGVFQANVLTPGTVDVAAPTAMLLAPPSVVGNSVSSNFALRYSDDVAINIQTINFGDVWVTGPNGFSQTAAFYGLNVNSNGATRDATYFFTAPGGKWDFTDNGTYTIQLQSQQVFDTAGKPVAATMLGSFNVQLPPPESQPPADMTENNASDWYAAADGATAATSDDTTQKIVGAASVRFDTTGGFDTYLRYEPPAGAAWDLTDASEFHLNVFAENPSPIGFQESSIKFIDLDGDAMEFRYWLNDSPYPIWNDARGAWLGESIAIKSAAQPTTGWRGTAIGTPDWSRMQTVEIHADTWDSGFTLWFDGLGFNLPPQPVRSTVMSGFSPGLSLVAPCVGSRSVGSRRGVTPQDGAVDQTSLHHQDAALMAWLLRPLERKFSHEHNAGVSDGTPVESRRHFIRTAIRSGFSARPLTDGASVNCS